MTAVQSRVAIIVRTQNTKTNSVRLYNLFLSSGIRTILYDQGPIVAISTDGQDLSVVKDSYVFQRILMSLESVGQCNEVIIVTDEVSTLSDPEGIRYFVNVLSYYPEWDLASLVRIRTICTEDVVVSESYPKVIELTGGIIRSAFILRQKALQYLKDNEASLEQGVLDGTLLVYTTEPELFVYSMPVGSLRTNSTELMKLQRCTNATSTSSPMGQYSYLGMMIILFLLVTCATKLSRNLRARGQ